MPHLVFVGAANMDLVMRVPRFAAPGETILGRDFSTIPGGKAANQAVAARRLGAEVTLLGCLGRDDFGRQLLSNLAAEGINTEHIVIDPEAASGVAMITLNEAGQNLILVDSGANLRLTPEHLRAAWGELGAVDAVVTEFEIEMATVLEAARLGRETGARVIINPSPAPPDGVPEEIFRLADLVVPNQSEANLLTGKPARTRAEAEEAARVLLETGAGAVVLTLGEDGAIVLERGAITPTHAPGYRVEVVDTTAAGDTFVGALAVAWTGGASLAEAARRANGAAALCVTKLGAQPSLPTRAAVEAFLKSH